MRPATVDACDRVKRDPKEAREIRAAYDPTSKTIDTLNSHLVVERISIQTWRTRSGHEQKLVSYHVSKELQYSEPEYNCDTENANTRFTTIAPA